jgi:hypothetical protein
VSFDQSDMVQCVQSALMLIEACSAPEEKAFALFLAVRALCCVRKYAEAEILFKTHAQELDGGTGFALAQTLLFLYEEKLDFAESAVPSAASIEALTRFFFFYFFSFFSSSSPSSLRLLLLLFL